ncbi:MAG: ubiquinone/menaquinone biosynthesis methyltransferase [Thermoleophilia bacterium]|nr:ubiquinone/menaquinone biosynthesis methyltransferase [Thermoleophilia bacterium]
MSGGDRVTRRFEGAYGALYDSIVSRPAGLRVLGLAVGSGRAAGSIGRLARDAYSDARDEPLLDVPCGALSSLVHASSIDRRGEIVGLDLSPSMLARGRRRAADVAAGFPVRLVEGDALAMPFDADTFGAVLSINGLHCVTDPQRMVDEVARVLRPGGTFTFTSLVATGSLHSRTANAALARTHVIPGAPPSIRELDAFLEAAGFGVFERRDGRALVARRCRLR